MPKLEGSTPESSVPPEVSETKAEAEALGDAVGEAEAAADAAEFDQSVADAYDGEQAMLTRGVASFFHEVIAGPKAASDGTQTASDFPDPSLFPAGIRLWKKFDTAKAVRKYRVSERDGKRGEMAGFAFDESDAISRYLRQCEATMNTSEHYIVETLA